MFELYGCNYGKCASESGTVLLATFSTKKKALAYVKKARIKKTWRGKKFRPKSLLGDYWYAHVQKREEPPEVPHDPEL